MTQNNYEVIDLCKSSSDYWLNLFKKMIKDLHLISPNDKLLKNYLNLDLEYSNYESFTLLTENKKIIAFSGMHGDIYSDGISRVLSRLYYTPEIRSKSLNGRTLPSLASRHMLPIHFEKAVQLNKSHIFLSFEGLNRRPFCFKLAKALGDYYNQDWYVHKEMCNTARLLPNGELNMNSDVWQNIIVLHLNDKKKFSLPSMSIENWKHHFESQ